jgi:two-component sensor histidine kinase
MSLDHVAERFGQVVDVTSVRICSWILETKTATVLAEYISTHASGEEQVPSVGASQVREDPAFLEALLAGQPWVECLGDPDLSGHARNHLQELGLWSILYIPLHIECQVAAYVELCESRETTRDFTAEAKTACQAIAQNAAIAIENTQLSRTNTELAREIEEGRRAGAELLQRNRELVSLQSAAAAISASLDLDFVLDTVTWEMVSLLDAKACVVSEWDQSAGVVSTLAEYGPAVWQEKRAALKAYDLADYPFREQALVERSTYQLTVGEADIDSAERAYMQTADVKTLLMLPMVFQGRVVGLIEVTDDQTERRFTDYQISLAQFLATQTASAIENARLYEQAQDEIVKRAQIEEEIRKTLKEKDMLLKEIHHRVKNNLQVISSLLRLQARNTQDRKTQEMFQESQNRIQSMALIHEKLHRSRDLNKIDFAEYIRDLANDLVHLFRTHSGLVALEVDAADGVSLGIDAAIPCGLIVNELISNSLKHAFPDGRAGKIRVEIHSHPDREMTMIVGDNGVGFPKDLDFRNTETLGLQLVNSLTAQLGGEIELRANGGTEFKITFIAPQ